MNFLTATVEGDEIVSALGRATRATVRQQVQGGASGRNIILGVRPEHFEDAEAGRREAGGRFNTRIDMVESMGSDVYAYFAVQDEAARSKDLEALAADTGQDMTAMETEITARLDASAKVAADHDAELWYDTSKMHVFDANTGLKLTADEPVSA